MSKDRLSKMAGGSLKDVVPVSGTVSIDGSPASGVNMYLHDKTGTKEVKQCRTGSDGTYCWSTHTACDGLEPEEYKLTFRHVPKEKSNRQKEEDLLKGRYSADPAASEFVLKVEKGKPQKDVNYSLSTK